MLFVCGGRHVDADRARGSANVRPREPARVASGRRRSAGRVDHRRRRRVAGRRDRARPRSPRRPENRSHVGRRSRPDVTLRNRTSSDGTLFVSDEAVLWRVDAATGAKEVPRARRVRCRARPGRGRRARRVYVATTARDVRRFDPAGRAEVVMPDVAVAHGSRSRATALLVSDTGRDASSDTTRPGASPSSRQASEDRAVPSHPTAPSSCASSSGRAARSRIDPSGAKAIVSRIGWPIGVAIAADGSRLRRRLQRRDLPSRSAGRTRVGCSRLRRLNL